MSAGDGRPGPPGGPSADPPADARLDPGLDRGLDRGLDPLADAAPVGAALDRVLRSLGAGSGGMVLLAQRWGEVAGPLAARCRPAELTGDGVLVVAVDDPAFVTELRYSGARLAAAANEVLGAARVVRVEPRVRRGPGGAAAAAT